MSLAKTVLLLYLFTMFYFIFTKMSAGRTITAGDPVACVMSTPSLEPTHRVVVAHGDVLRGRDLGVRG